jgi:hypothetical protein
LERKCREGSSGETWKTDRCTSTPSNCYTMVCLLPQPRALVLLTFHSHTISEQTTLLRSPENAKKIQKIADDTSTIRATRSQIGSTGTPSIKSQDHSSVASRAFPWDDQLITTGPYRRAFNHYRSKSDLPPRTLSPKFDVHIHDSPVDEGYETMSKATADSTQSGDHCKYNRPVHSDRFTL